MTTDKRAPSKERSRPATEVADTVDTVLDKGLVLAGYAPVSLLGIELLTAHYRRFIQAASLPKRSSAPPGTVGEVREPGVSKGTWASPRRSGRRRPRGRDSPASARFREKAVGSVAGMNGGQMHRLGKRLIQLAAAVTGEPGETRLPLGEAAVFVEVLEGPGISIKEIHERTGLSQSHVAASVARLRNRGLLETAPDGGSAWRSNTRAQASDYALQTISRRQSRPVDEAVIRAVGDPTQARRAIRLMDELADILL